MRVAHSGTSKLKDLPNLPKIDTCSEPWKRVSFVVRNWIFIVLTLHARSYLSCKNQRLYLLTLVTLTCQNQVEYRKWGQFVLISGVPCYTYNFCMCVFPYNLVLLCNYMVWTYGVAHSGTSKLKDLPNLPKIDTCSEPWKKLCRNWIFMYLLYMHVATYPVRIKAYFSYNLRIYTGPAGQFVSISGVCYTYIKCHSIRLKLLSYCAVQLHGLNICGSLTAGRQSWKIFQICQKLTHAASPEKG